MLALESLVSGTKLNKVLNGALLPENNNPAFLQVADVHSTTVLFANKAGESILIIFLETSLPIPGKSRASWFRHCAPLFAKPGTIIPKGLNTHFSFIH
jgi:hypothetical protein